MGEEECESERNEDSERLEAARKRTHGDENVVRAHDEGDLPWRDRGEERSPPSQVERLVLTADNEKELQRRNASAARTPLPAPSAPSLPRASDQDADERPGEADCS